VGAVLRALREERDWSQATLARRARVGIATVARIENAQINTRTGKVDIPKSPTLRRLAQALGDGNAERTRGATRALFDAAGYGEEDEPAADDPATEIAALRQRVEVLERATRSEPADIAARIHALLASYPPDKRAEAISLMQEALRRYAVDPQRSHADTAG
jgi:transcriptional regulator with XRE-family HTH domain